MRKSFAASIFAALLLALGTGAAFAGNGHGGDGHDNGWRNGGGDSGQVQQSQDHQQYQSSKHDDRRSAGGDRGSAQSQSSRQTTTSQEGNAGVKPSSTTQKDTYARADSDKTKRYGNGGTAGRIATSRGAAGDTVLHGPGNSQPHKVLACGKRHEVDVHAVKSYSSSCDEQPKQQVAGVSHEQEHSSKQDENCSRTVTVTVPAGVWHDAGSKWVRSDSKHEGDLVVDEPTTRTISISDACKQSESAVQAAAFQQAVAKCGHRVESVVKVQEQEQKPAQVAPAATDEKKVYICHATGSSTNPYVLIHVSKNAEWAHTHHQDGRDVVLGETLTRSCPSAPPASSVAPTQAQNETCTTQQQVQVVAGVKHYVGPKGSGRYVIIHPNEHSAHFAGKHPDELVYETRTIEVAVPCPTTTAATTTAAAQTETVVPPTQTVTVTTPATTTPATGGVAGTTAAQTTPTETTPAQGGVLGAQATIAPKAKPGNGGVLGTSGRIASSRLPFTGIELWIFAVVAGGLIAAGLMLRRSGRGTL